MAASSETVSVPGTGEEAIPGRPLAGGALWVTGSRLVIIASSAAVSIVTARLLGPAGTGRFALAVTSFGFLSLFGTLGLDIGVVWEITRRRWPVARAFAATQRVAVAVGLAGAAIGFVAYALTDGFGVGGPSWAEMLPVFVALPFALSWMFGAGVALASDRYDLAFGLGALQAVAYAVTIAALVPALGLPGALAGILVSNPVAAGVLRLAGGDLRRGERSGAGGEDRRRLVGAISFGWRLYAAGILFLVNYRIDLFILAASVPTADVGYYAVAVALTLPLSAVAGSLGVVLYPRMASLGGDSDGAREIESKTLRHAVVLILVGGIGLAAVLIWLVTPIFGARYGPVTEPGLILLPGAGAVALFHVLSGSLTGRGRPQDVLNAMLVTTPVTIALYLLLIPAHGVTGAALASTISYSLSALLLGYFLHRADDRFRLMQLVPGRGELADYRALAWRLRIRPRQAG